MPSKIIVAARRPIEAAEDRHERRFAGARRAHDGDELAALDRQADAAQRLHVDVADVIGPRDILDPDDRLRRIVAHAASEPGQRTAAWLLLAPCCSAMMT